MVGQTPKGHNHPSCGGFAGARGASTVHSVCAHPMSQLRALALTRAAMARVLQRVLIGSVSWPALPPGTTAGFHALTSLYG